MPRRRSYNIQFLLRFLAPIDRSTPAMMGPSRCRWWSSRSTSVINIFRLCALVLAIASATVMAASGECTTRSDAGDAVTITYTHFRSFVLLVGCCITVVILEAVAVYLQLSTTIAAADDYKTISEMEEEEGIGCNALRSVLCRFCDSRQIRIISILKDAHQAYRARRNTHVMRVEL